MNKIQVGFAPSPNLKAAKSKIGSLDNATHKPGGGNVKIESRKIQIEAKPRTQARNGNFSQQKKKEEERFFVFSLLQKRRNKELDIFYLFFLK